MRLERDGLLRPETTELRGRPSESRAELAARDDSYSVEINAGGSLIFGYNWNTKTEAEGEGLYRLTYVIDGSARCGIPSNTIFDETTVLANPGNINPGQVVPKAALILLGGDGSEGGLAYIDVQVSPSNGGGGGGNKGGGPPSR